MGNVSNLYVRHAAARILREPVEALEDHDLELVGVELERMYSAGQRHRQAELTKLVPQDKYADTPDHVHEIGNHIIVEHTTKKWGTEGETEKLFGVFDKGAHMGPRVVHNWYTLEEALLHSIALHSGSSMGEASTDVYYAARIMGLGKEDK